MKVKLGEIAKSKKRKVIIFVSLTFVITIAGLTWWIFVPRQTPSDSLSSYPLGDKLEYIGKRDYGCNFLCSSLPTSTYSYGTDMEPEEIASYFKKAAPTTPSQIEEWRAGGESVWIDFKNTLSNQVFTIWYYNDGQKQLNKFNLSDTTKKHVVELDKQSYINAKDSL